MAEAAADKSSSLKRAGQFAVYALFRALEAVIGILPLTLVARIGHMLGGLGVLFDGLVSPSGDAQSGDRLWPRKG